MSGPLWDYSPCIHNFTYTADIDWPRTELAQMDWITGIQQVEEWLVNYTGPKYSHWTWHTAREIYHIGVAFKYDRHKMLFLLYWS